MRSARSAAPTDGFAGRGTPHPSSDIASLGGYGVTAAAGAAGNEKIGRMRELG